MATYSRQLLSGSTNGRPVPVIAVATPGTAIHVALTGNGGFDEIYAWVSNVTAAAATLTIEYGGTGTSNQATTNLSLPANSPPIPILTGQVLQNGLSVAMFSGTTNALNVTGYVNRIQ